MILMIDNYDSFTFNIVQYLMQMGREVCVYRNDEITPGDITDLAPEAIVLSPGPGRPAGAGISTEVVCRFYKTVPLLGICLGHQCIGEAFGGETVRAARIMHGKVSSVHHDGRTIFAGLPEPLSAGRYHSLMLNPDSLPECLEVSAQTAGGEIMGIRHRQYRVEGIQFHPESVLTPQGRRLLKNFLKYIGEKEVR
ncbi:MAG TPA: aminodeoxychorismate/anthranilate synthase component II [Smithellaceae bacterium]|jgi:anthranilate synthase/aminodeoxychorismate synthase-like glutamine amidotransferase|nr:aminodeoxychorismate/anthranilate synthase component II [Smithellaceae bacterium]HQF83842.1 aminodeoxychorismate/anthranilate synthase component II [Smithellaceae bacterium]HQG80014.1 aminodeoxychorismate/anthranilate synthase component II [Smithellaceae bacterium]